MQKDDDFPPLRRGLPEAFCSCLASRGPVPLSVPLSVSAYLCGVPFTVSSSEASPRPPTHPPGQWLLPCDGIRSSRSKRGRKAAMSASMAQESAVGGSSC